MFYLPELEMKALILAVDGEKDLLEEDIKSADKHILWSINYDRFNREFRDQVSCQNAHFFITSILYPPFISSFTLFGLDRHNIGLSAGGSRLRINYVDRAIQNIAFVFNCDIKLIKTVESKETINISNFFPSSLDFRHFCVMSEVQTNLCLDFRHPDFRHLLYGI